MAELTYNSSDNVAFKFRKDSLCGLLSFRFSETNISLKCNISKYENALRLKKISESEWAVLIIWDKVKMTAKEENIEIKVLYSGEQKLCEDVKIKYPLQSPSANVFECKLSKNTAMWGTNGTVTSLCVNLKSGYELWMFDDMHISVKFKLFDDKGFASAADGVYRKWESFGIVIPLKYVGYDNPISENIIKYVCFSINGMDFPTPLEFTFTPRPYSYEAVIRNLKDSFQYGAENRKLCIIQLERKDKLSPVARKIEVKNFQPNNLIDISSFSSGKENNWGWNVLVKSDANYEVLSKGINASVVFDIDEGQSSCQAFFSIEKILPGVKPELKVSPLGKTVGFIGDTVVCTLTVTNKCFAEINISSIIFESVHDSLIKIIGEKQKRIQSQSNVVYNLEINNAKPLETHAKIIVKTDETNDAFVEYYIKIKERPEAIITIDIPSDGDNGYREIVVGNSYRANDCCAICRVGYSKDSSPDCKLIDLSKINFGPLYHFSNKDSIDKIIPRAGCRDVRLLFNDNRKITKKELVGKRGNTFILPCSWNYHDQSGHCEIPTKLPLLYGKRCRSFNDSVFFPKPEENRVIPIMEFEFRQLTEEDNEVIWDSNQKLMTKTPFSFSKKELIGEVNIKPGEIVTFFLHINEIVGIDENTLNITEKKLVDIEATIQSDNHEEMPVSFLLDNGERLFPKIINLLPIEAKPKPRVVFRTNKGDCLLRVDSPVSILIDIKECGEDISAHYVGDIVFQNKEKIPCQDYGVKFADFKVEIICDGDDILHGMTVESIPNLITIFNGDPDVCISIYLDYDKWKSTRHKTNPKFIITFKPFIKDSDKDFKEYEACSFGADFELNHIFIDDVYSLDLGTTGIVVAKESDDEPECVILEDVSKNPIEKDAEILSSHTMILSEAEDSSIILAPTANEYYQQEEGKQKYRLVPSKFIVGQERIPFLSDFYENNDVKKDVKLFNLVDKSSKSELTLNLKLTNKEENERTISQLIASLYKEIFRRCDQEVNKIKKLVVTYPNTYTIENLEGIKEIMMSELGLTLKGQICFVPESDAVAAYYFNQKIIFDNGFLDEKGNPVDVENVIFYDMGAGTLDLSLVSFKKENDDGILASIVNKIGIPLAGNYLDYIIFKTLIDGKWVKSDFENKHNAIKELTTDIKKNYDESRTIGEINPSWLMEHQGSFDNIDEFKKKKYSEIFDDSIKGFVEACGITSLRCLIPQGTNVHTVVFSGRGSQFGPIRRKVTESLNNMMGTNVIVDKLMPTNNCGDYLKTCVALGALTYQKYFNNDGPFRIENKNIYSKIAVVYWGKINGVYDVNVVYLVDPLSKDWSNANYIDGSKCLEFVSDITIENHIAGKKMYYIQTSLAEDDLKELYRKVYRKDSSSKDDPKWAFVNLLFEYSVFDTNSIPVRLKISKDDKIVYREIGHDILTGKKLLENVEDNIIYRRSMWPFITSLK